MTLTNLNHAKQSRSHVRKGTLSDASCPFCGTNLRVVRVNSDVKEEKSDDFLFGDSHILVSMLKVDYRCGSCRAEVRAWVKQQIDEDGRPVRWLRPYQML